MKYDKVHIIGDSHYGTLHGYAGPDLPDLVYYYSHSPMTMYLASQQKDFPVVPKNGLWIFCFGEIDVRCCIYNQIHEKNREEDEVINTLVETYVENLLSIYPEIAIMSIVPPVKFYSGNYDPELNDSTYPFVGPDEDRARYTKKLNIKLQQKCNDKNLIYINIYDHYRDADGFLIKELSDGNVHILQRDKVSQIMKDLDLC